MKTQSGALTVERVFAGPPAERMRELRSIALFLMNNRGMQDLLQAMIEVLEEMNAARRETYIETLIRDLQKTRAHYMARYER
jgi:hypothetical protein